MSIRAPTPETKPPEQRAPVSVLPDPADASRAASAKLKLDVLVYSETPAGRMVFINGRRYSEGDAVEGQGVIEEILPDGVALRHQGQRFTIR
jgi:hypothetical protein